MSSAAKGFVDGLMAGSDWRQRQARSTRINKALDYELKDLEDMRAGGDRIRAAAGADAAALPDPVTNYWKKAGGAVANFFGFGKDKEEETPDSVQAPQTQPAGSVVGGNSNNFDTGQMTMQGIALRDGGPVADEGNHRIDPETGRKTIYIPLRDDPREMGEDLKYNAGQAVGQFVADVKGGMEPIVDSLKGNVVDPIVGAADTAIEVGKGLLLNREPAPRRGDVPADQQQAVETRAPTANDAPAGTTQPPGQTPAATPRTAGAGVAAQPGVETRANRAPTPAIEAPTQAPAPAPAAVTRLRPEDVPAFKTRDWQRYREEVTLGLIQQGVRPSEAHAEVDKVQMNGFLSHAQRAMVALQSGMAEEAAVQMKMAYSYFPNGSDVWFDMTTDASGQPAIIGRGRDEESGEEVGKPMILNAERASAMIDNLQRPGAWRSWTKDWRTEKMQREIFEAEGPLKAYDAETRRINANASLERARSLSAYGRSGSGGMKPSDASRFSKDMRERIFLLEQEDPQLADELKAVAGQLFSMTDGLKPDAVIRAVMRAHEGDETAIEMLAEFGLSVPPAEREDSGWFSWFD